MIQEEDKGENKDEDSSYSDDNPWRRDLVSEFHIEKWVEECGEMKTLRYDWWVDLRKTLNVELAES